MRKFIEDTAETLLIIDIDGEVHPASRGGIFTPWDAYEEASGIEVARFVRMNRKTLASEDVTEAVAGAYAHQHSVWEQCPAWARDYLDDCVGPEVEVF